MCSSDLRLRALFRSMNRATILADCERIGLPFAPINRPEDMFDDPHLNHPGAMVEMTVPGGSATRIPALPLEWSGERFGLHHDIPLAGGQSRAILAELGLGVGEIDGLLARGVVGTVA